jgi:hypothetical protein
VLVHAVAASLILLLDASHKTDPDPGVANSIQIVRDTIGVLRGLVDHSIIARSLKTRHNWRAPEPAPARQ